MHRTATEEAVPADHLYKLLAPNALIEDGLTAHLAQEWAMAQSGSFEPVLS